MTANKDVTVAQAVPKIYGAMLHIMRNIQSVAKDQKNSHFNYNFRSIDAVLNSLHDTVSQAGVFILINVLEVEQLQRERKVITQLKVRYTFVAEDGSSVHCDAVGQGEDTSDKGTNKALQGAYKYMLMQMFLIPTSDKKDPDAEWEEQQAQEKRSASKGAIDGPNYDGLRSQQPKPEPKSKAKAEPQQPTPEPKKETQYTMQEVLSAIRMASTRQELVVIYNSVPHLHGYSDLVTALTARKAELPA